MRGDSIESIQLQQIRKIRRKIKKTEEEKRVVELALPAPKVATNGDRRWLKIDPTMMVESDRSWAISLLEALFFARRKKTKH